MKILVLGSGAREHAIILALAAEGAGHDLLAAPGNAGIARDAEIVPGLDQNDPVAVTEFAGSANVDLVIVGPEAPLIAGVADALRERGIPVFGPGKVAAQLEGSKAFAKRVMDEAGVPTGRAVRARSRAEVETALDELGTPHVVKADGLAAGKGVIVTDDREAALAHADTYLSSGPVLIEEFLAGPEVSLFFVSDGDTVRALSPAQDYKRAYDGDAGPNTGGMGAYSPLPWLADRFGSEAGFVAEVTRDVAEPVIRHLDAEGTPFIGLLYAGLILTESGIKVIEFNARFGDPETQVVLARLTSPLSELLMAAASGRLESEPDPTFSDDAAVTVVLASEGYPDNPVTGRALTGLDAAASVESVHLAHAATAESVDGLVATGGRVLNVVARGADFTEARDRAYRALAEISLEGSHHRTDIAARVAD
ncbi:MULTISPECIES: phosphoribosylamine--glycine ligase [Microbacterium]|uniref:Phosphoribosylamine--glycine ligase n=1 Tax=Microbacterium paludicola TaxID=300019 RepID=A0ABU1I2L4_9MICO|nr:MULTISPECIES: phosphoribosylamine--glycine ligase [Microbacterium]MDR6168137.1 phosphoribosylamine--glycine ligase [Microbacterium paludicola]QCR39143.1 phosphoribosylamine--glycine ligase [Microbacterium sp. SGAir0570]RAZ32823.1 phosphoribosylamine--glycine ligase [Microbacterium sp. SMR1]